MKDFTNSRARAVAVLAKMFSEIVVLSDDPTSLEYGAVNLERACMAEAIGLVLSAKTTP